MARHGISAVLLAAGFILALGALRPHPALALSTETFPLNYNGQNFADPDEKVYQQYKLNDDALSGNSSSSSGDSAHNLTFGSPDSGFSMSVGRTDTPYGTPFSGPRFFGSDPFIPPR